jgi:hypothetical protein
MSAFAYGLIIFGRPTSCGGRDVTIISYDISAIADERELFPPMSGRRHQTRTGKRGFCKPDKPRQGWRANPSGFVSREKTAFFFRRFKQKAG